MDLWCDEEDEEYFRERERQEENRRKPHKMGFNILDAHQMLRSIIEECNLHYATHKERAIIDAIEEKYRT